VKLLGTLALCGCAILSVPALAQSSAPQASATAGGVKNVGTTCKNGGDVTFDADVGMQSLKFDVVPRRATVATSGGRAHGGYTVTRTNVPNNPKPGVTYKNARVQVHAGATLVNRAAGPRASAPGSLPLHLALAPC